MIPKEKEMRPCRPIGLQFFRSVVNSIDLVIEIRGRKETAVEHIVACVAIGSLFLGGTAASADIYLEVTRSGEAADGFWDDAIFNEMAFYDLWLYSDTGSSGLWSMQFDIGGTPEQPGTQWWIGASGQIDPNGMFNLLANGGDLVDGLISNAQVASIVPVTVPTGPENAILLYEGFGATNYEVGGRLFAGVDFLDTVLPGESVVSIGMLQTPAPGSLAVLGVALLATRCRRPLT